jgi:hypothetical protein
MYKRTSNGLGIGNSFSKLLDKNQENMIRQDRDANWNGTFWTSEFRDYDRNLNLPVDLKSYSADTDSASNGSQPGLASTSKKLRTGSVNILAPEAEHVGLTGQNLLTETTSLPKSTIWLPT